MPRRRTQHPPGMLSALHCQQMKQRSSDTALTTTPFDPGASTASAVEGPDDRTPQRRPSHQSQWLGWITTLLLQKAFEDATSSSSPLMSWVSNNSLKRDEAGK